MTSKHTPGPWRLHLVDDTTIIDSDGRFIASVCGGDDDLGSQDYNNPDEWPVMEANARLIAMAPRMYEALKTVFQMKTVLIREGMYGDIEAILNELETNQ
jgi:hypothetical protein